ncbi:MAG: InlB B-repeat-containing protein [Clostridiales bacterium]|nr:MAG: InlB B-repeat-containing protein [Clostridiales bacterium]
MSVNADITLYAQWTINKFAVTFVTGEGVSGTISANEAVYNGTVNVSAVSGDGYNSPVITAVPQENAELVSEGVYRIKRSCIVCCLCTGEKKIYTANFLFLKADFYYTQSAVEGSSATVALPTPPVKAGHSFAGWYTEKTGGVKVDETTVLDKDLTVYARFDVNTLNITPAESGEGYTVSSDDGTTVNYGGDYSFTVTAADHYNADNMKVYANGILLSGSKNGKVYYYTVKNITANQTITVTGVELDKHTVTYMVNGQVYLTVQAEYNAYLSEPASPSKVGETFKGWSDRQKIWDFSTDRVTSDTVLYPVWESGMLSITPAESGEGYAVSSNDGTTVNYGGDYSFTVTAADHYNADNMKVYANGILLIPEANGNVYKFTVKNITDNITITVFDVTADIYTVKYVVDGEVYYSEKVIYNGRAQKPKSPSKTGYVFKGWFDGSDEWNFEDGIENDLELEAKFETLVYAVSVPDNRSEFTVNVTSDSRVEHGGGFSFNITVSDGFSASDMMVYANGVLPRKTSEYGNTVYF